MGKILVALIGGASLALATNVAAEQGAHHNGPNKGQQDGNQTRGPGHAKHQHHEKNGHALLGAKLKENGKHTVGKFKDRDVTAEVRNGKVVTMAAGDLTPKRVRSKTKMAESGLLIRAAWNGGLQLAQYDPYYYGYCFDDEMDADCYWYPADDVDYQNYTWEDYDPYY